MKGQPFVIVGGSTEESMRIREELKLHWESGIVYERGEKVFTVFDLNHENCGMNLVHFCGVIVEEYQDLPELPFNLPREVIAFKDRTFFEECHTSVAVMA